jgi:hypothetical protein
MKSKMEVVIFWAVRKFSSKERILAELLDARSATINCQPHLYGMSLNV